MLSLQIGTSRAGGDVYTYAMSLTGLKIQRGRWEREDEGDRTQSLVLTSLPGLQDWLAIRLVSNR